MKYHELYKLVNDTIDSQRLKRMADYRWTTPEDAYHLGRIESTLRHMLAVAADGSEATQESLARCLQSCNDRDYTLLASIDPLCLGFSFAGTGGAMIWHRSCGEWSLHT